MKWAYRKCLDLIIPNAPDRGLIPVNLLICSAPQMESPHALHEMPYRESGRIKFCEQCEADVYLKQAREALARLGD